MVRTSIRICGCNGYGWQTTHNSSASRSCCDADLIERAKRMLESAFFEALKEVHVEKIPRIIDRNCGNNIDKAAELMVRTVEKLCKLI